jgi:hypothetical protein
VHSVTGVVPEVILLQRQDWRARQRTCWRRSCSFAYECLFRHQLHLNQQQQQQQRCYGLVLLYLASVPTT